jgi:diphosphomevalonate decarboxylase
MPPVLTATAQASPNIAFVKYWGNRDDELRIPSNGSISMTLRGLYTTARVSFDPAAREDTLVIGGQPASADAAHRVSAHLDLVRMIAREDLRARVESFSNFPADSGIASSASAFAAITLAGVAACGLPLDSPSVSRLARRGSGSACRSVFGGFVEWQAGDSDVTSFAAPLALPDHWPLVDLIAVVSQVPKGAGSTEGHRLAATSPLQEARVLDAPRRLTACRQAILQRDFDALAEVVELDSLLMHAVMMTSSPPLQYWRPSTLSILNAVAEWRRRGAGVCATVDAGPNVHCVCAPGEAEAIRASLQGLHGVELVLECPPGEGARVLPSEGML